MEDMHISLISAGLAALIAAWLSLRCAQVRVKEKILHGDGGHGLMMRRMRAQANFTEYTPFALVLIVVLDLADVQPSILGPSALAFLIGRVLHAIGMDAAEGSMARQIGMVLTLPILLGWGIWAIVLGFNAIP